MFIQLNPKDPNLEAFRILLEKGKANIFFAAIEKIAKIKIK